jgi:GTP pyrophosphokinase
MERLRDWISIPKANGYEALHTTVMSHTGQWVEIQIRSRRMDEIAEKGYAAHWKYKEAMHLNSRLDNWLDRIKEMIESPDADALSFIDDVKGFFFLDEISVFTPQGELRTLPSGSTVLDFAYAIHSELGNTCIGAKVDKKLGPINHVLKNGQQVEIITSMKQYPKEEWLGYVVTTRAKSSIKMAVRAEKKKFAKTGKEKLGLAFAKIGLDFSNGNVKKFLAANNFNSFVDLYYAVSQGTIGLKDVKLFAASNVRNGWLNYISRGAANGTAAGEVEQNRQHGLHTTGIIPSLGTSADAPGYVVAPCCNPIPGDEVVGLISSDHLPMQIHRTKCPKAMEIMMVHENKMVVVNWVNHELISFLAEIKVTGIDRQGLINEITRIISNDLSLNIKSFHIEALNGLTEGAIALYVKNTEDLSDVVSNLNLVEGITHVTRVN